MTETASSSRLGRPRAVARVAWTVLSFFVVEVIVCGAAAWPVLLVWRWLLSTAWLHGAVRLALLSLAVVPSYVAFALLLMITSPAATWLVRWRTPRDVALRIADLDWPLLTWVRYVAAIRLVRVLAGALFCGSPLWTGYVRLNGARIGRRVYINTLLISDHNLLEFGDDVVIGAEVHISGHTVESGLVKTGAVRLDPHVTIGLGSVIDIDVQAGAGCQVGALTFVPKHARLESGATYVGIPARRLS